MPRYAAFLRGVMPTNCKMADLKRAFESAGFENVKTVLGSGNVVFDAPATSIPALERRIEAAVEKKLGKPFLTIVRPVEKLRAMIEADPYREHRLAPGAKRIVTFVRKLPGALKLPIEQDGARMLRADDDAVFSAYLPTPKGPVFMTLIEKAVGKEQTTRTWQTIEKVVR